ncbi:carboxymuconolactone decarboxylase family protein [Enterococcus quebecensis]|uniref:Carboxymuconolactone decarboxylase n=1 Tax=Enterococcus quebecensis TaxID=903983 RepID=A0A1E5GTF8_9ENTE|nr:carboxymuconolactone decarboxylase family protein [Enterococcus quebecensis]OEG15964.1 carboxymuconolactone decarboxylase [Enterococcus quebecensis]OJG74937.1 gamma-carboxymuconolactone decarboxylase [Enterococcus quebecensis]
MDKKTRVEIGLENLLKIDGEDGKKVIDALEGVAPDLGKLILEFTFADVYERGVLDWKQREIITITSLLTLGGTEKQLDVHINAALNVGVTEEEVVEIFIQCSPYVGFPRVLNAIFVAKEVFATRKKS